MPARKQDSTTRTEPLYPNLEGFLETADHEAAAGLFSETRARLEGLSGGAKAPAAKKALAGVARAEALIAELYEVRTKLEEKAHAKKGRR